MILDPILIVDDEPDLRETLKESLEMDGYAVEAAGSATEALAALDRRFFPVVVTDLNMPGGPTGFDLIAAVKARDQRILCIVLTGQASLDSAVTAVKEGAYDFIQKPFRIQEVEAVLDRALEHARLLRQLDTYQRDLESRVTSKMLELCAFRNDVESLVDLFEAALQSVDESEALGPFLTFLATHFDAAGWAWLRPGEGGWRRVIQAGPREFRAEGLPGPDHLEEIQEWNEAEGYAESFLVPLRAEGKIQGAVLFGCESRTSFSLDDPLLRLWQRLAGAACAAWLQGSTGTGRNSPRDA